MLACSHVICHCPPLMVWANLFTHVPRPRTIWWLGHACSHVSKYQHHYMVACEYLFTHMYYPSTISGSVGKTICPYTMCLHHQVSAWACLFPHMPGHSIIAFYREFIRLHAFLMPVLSCSSKRASLFTHEQCPSPIMWQHGHVCSHVDYDPAP